MRRRAARTTARRAALGWAIVLTTAAAIPPLGAQQSTFNAHDDYTEYHLLDPASHAFHIVYYLNQRQVGATTVLNQTRSGSEGSDISVTDPQTGQPLKFEYRTGAELTTAGETGRLNAAEHYIRAFLARPVPEGGEGRVRIEKTYRDEKSYSAQNEEIVFARSLGIGRNAIVLPKGFVIGSSNVAAQVTALADGRLKLVFENVNTYASDVSIRGRKSAAPVVPALKVVERAFDFAKTLYDLGDVAVHRVAVRHEYVETRTGATPPVEFLARHRLANVVATDMDSGRPLVLSQRGGAWTVALATAIQHERQSAHVRIAGEESDAGYRLEGSYLAWEKSVHEPRTTILLPAGWEPVAISSPATVTTTREGRVAIQVYNPRVEPAAVAIRAVRAK